jgi:hypothetical protein
MSLQEHIDSALDRLGRAGRKLEAARRGDDLRPLLDALTDYVLALSDVQALDREALDETLNRITGRLGMDQAAGQRPAAR